jgi:hypothetical protein
MDQKMIEQRKRRIALKKMFEEMVLGPNAAQQAGVQEPPVQQQQMPQ